MVLLNLVTFLLGTLSIVIAVFTLREKWRTRRPTTADPADVLALRDIAAAIRELKIS
jgi:hypothetical protein